MSELLDCGHLVSKHGAIDMGYGYDSDGKKYCYGCCADKDRELMVGSGKAILYMCDGEITNWPGSLRFQISHKRKGRHNMARVRYDAWFTGPDGKPWHAVTYGDNTQIAHCRRVAA